jgi:hypothetical protein
MYENPAGRISLYFPGYSEVLEYFYVVLKQVVCLLCIIDWMEFSKKDMLRAFLYKFSHCSGFLFYRS